MVPGLDLDYEATEDDAPLESAYVESSTSPMRAETLADFEYRTVPDEFRFVRCAGCGHRYLSPRPSGSDLGVIYPADYYAFGADGSSAVARLRRRWEGGKVRLYQSTGDEVAFIGQ